MRQIFALILLVLSAQKLLAYTPISDERLKELLSGFNYMSTSEYIKTPKPQPGCHAQDLEYKSNYPQRVELLHIRAKTFIPVALDAPVVFILPPMGGMNQLDQGMAQAF